MALKCKPSADAQLLAHSTILMAGHGPWVQLLIRMRTANGWAGSCNADRIDVLATPHRLYSCVIVSRFRAALDLDTYPLRNLIRPRCAERAKPGRGKPVLIIKLAF